MPHFKAFGKMNLQYEIGICHKIHDKVTLFCTNLEVVNLEVEIQPLFGRIIQPDNFVSRLTDL